MQYVSIGSLIIAAVTATVSARTQHASRDAGRDRLIRFMTHAGEWNEDTFRGDLNGDGVIDLRDVLDVAAGLQKKCQDDPDDPAPDIHFVWPDGTLPVAGWHPISTLGDVFEGGLDGGLTPIFRASPLVNTTIWAPAGVPVLTPTIEGNWRPDGIDLRVVYQNTGAEPMSPAAIEIPFFDRTGDRWYRDMTRGGQLKPTVDGAVGSFNGPMRGYPGQYYAPVFVAENHTSGHVIGLSVQFPVLDYQQSIQFRAKDTGGSGGMLLTIHTNPDNVNAGAFNPYNPDWDIQPGETKTYEIAIRVRQVDFANDHPGSWMHTLVPYRNYFRCMYGGVRYQRNPEQVAAYALSMQTHLSDDNPYGFIHDDAGETYRPDFYGYTRWRQDWDAGAALGWDRIMVWTPTGQYQHSLWNNYPPQFTSEWPAILAGVLPGFDNTLAPLATYAQDTGGILGLWWGRSSQIADMWDDPLLETFDNTNPAHWAFRDNEMAGAISVNARDIGLDAFGTQGQWNGYRTLLRDQMQYPSVRFITEAIHPDFVHTLAPTFAVMTIDPGGKDGELYKYPQGIPIIDFLLPGHETWGQIQARWIKVFCGIPNNQTLTAEQARPFIEQVAAFGFVPVFGGNLPAEDAVHTYDAAASWLDTVPPELR